MKDLVVLTADKNMHFAVRGALMRPQSLGIRPITFEFRVHPGRDGGVRTNGPELISAETARFSHAVVLLDFAGCGDEQSEVADIEMNLNRRLELRWQSRSRAFVIAPEVDIWIWGSDNALAEVLNWQETPTVRQWLVAQGFEFAADGKPAMPKEAMEALVEKLHIARSSSLYEAITSKISLAKCSDATFARVREALQSWFPAQA